MPRTIKRGFTLIELLIVVAIIAILAAIAVPNFLEAQTRTKVTRTYADIRVIANGIEMYRIDHRDFPMVGRPMSSFPFFYVDWVMISPDGARHMGSKLTTPVQYLSSVPFDQFNSDLFSKTFGMRNSFTNKDWSVIFTGLPKEVLGQFHHHAVGLKGREAQSYTYFMESCGPNLTWESQGIPNSAGETGAYNPTNGTISNGNIVYYDNNRLSQQF